MGRDISANKIKRVYEKKKDQALSSDLTTEWSQCRGSDVFIVNFENISQIVLVFPMLILEQVNAGLVYSEHFNGIYSFKNNVWNLFRCQNDDNDVDLVFSLLSNCRLPGRLYSPVRMGNSSYKKSHKFRKLPLCSILYFD